MSITNDVRVEIYRSFVEQSRAPSHDEVARSLDVSRDEVVQAVRELAANDVMALQTGTDDVWLAHPFCATGGPFEVAAATRRWDAICIWDALGILALIEADGEVTSECPDCRETLIVRVQQGQVDADDDAVVHFGVPARDWYADIGFT